MIKINTNKAIRKLSKIPVECEKATRTGLVKSTNLIKQTAKMNVTVDTGFLRSMIFSSVSKGIGRVGCYTKYATYVEYGTGPMGAASPKDLPPGMNITYKDGPWFVKFVTKDGELVAGYTYGQAAQPFMYPAYRKNKSDIIRILNEEIKKGAQKAK